MLVVNCKNYAEASGAGLSRLAAAAARASARHGVRIMLAPPQHLLGAAARGPVPVLAQHVDDAAVGGTTGYVVPELLKKAGVGGSIINHSEHRVGPRVVGALVPRLRELGMISVLCVRNVAEARRYAGLNPDYIAIEPPELIGSGRAISQERPGLITQAAGAVAGSGARLLCGAGIVSGGDAALAVELGSEGILVASGVVRAKSPARAVSELARAMSRPGRGRRGS